MIDYDFLTLNDKEFENLTIDLISKDRNKRYERFKAGRDGGIDGRYYHDNDTQEIIQCKHYIKTGFNGLVSSLKNKNDNGINEIKKVENLNPLKYIFITSLPLSAKNKKTIKDFFNPYIKTDNDIYGQEDLNQILGDSPDIERRYYKLWLSSTVVLDRIFNNAIESRSEYLLEDIKENAKYYVVTDNHNKAIEKLEKSHIIIIAGEPGIGKTTLANHLALWYIEKGFKFYDIENSINEAENIYKRDENQIFYFDDFLGSNYLNAIENKKDSHIVKFMSRIKKDKTKKFILTSRTNIFNQGLALSDTFKSKNIENEEFIIKIDSLEDIDKATILYNHIWHSDLDEKFIDEIYIDKRYKQIINHKNFNPRIIEFITDIYKIEKIEAKDYWNYIVEKLDNPQDIWEKAFDKDSDEFTRIIVLLVVFNGNKIEENELQNSYYKYIKLALLQNSSNTSKEFDSIIKEVVKYFLNRKILYDGTIEYSLFNPSVADFILNRYRNNEKLKNIFLALQTEKSLIKLSDLVRNSFIDKIHYRDIISNIDYDVNYNIDYLVWVGYLLYSEFENESLPQNELILWEDKIYKIVDIVINKKEFVKSKNIYRFLLIVSYPNYIKPFKITPLFINKVTESTDYDSEDDIRELMYFIEYSLSSIDLKDYFPKIKLLVEKNLYNSYDHPSFLTDESFEQIEKIILNDIDTQSKQSISKHLNNIGLDDYSCNSNQNIKYIKDNIDINKTKSKIYDDIDELFER